MAFVKLVKADENSQNELSKKFWSNENLKSNFTHDVFKEIEHLINYGSQRVYKTSLIEKILTKEDILSAIEEATVRLEEAFDEILEDK